ASALFENQVQNNGTISADGYGATLKFDAITVDQSFGTTTVGTIAASNSAVIVFDGTTVSGGQITGDGSVNQVINGDTVSSLLIQVGDGAYTGVVGLTLEDGVSVVDQIMNVNSGYTLEVEH